MDNVCDLTRLPLKYEADIVLGLRTLQVICSLLTLDPCHPTPSKD
jgi:hypothetical protein